MHEEYVRLANGQLVKKSRPHQQDYTQQRGGNHGRGGCGRGWGQGFTHGGARECSDNGGGPAVGTENPADE